MARPRKYTDEQIIAALVKKKGLIFLAAKMLGCHADTIRDRATKSPAVATAITQQRGELVDNAELKMERAIQNGESWAIAMTLKCLGKNRGWVERTELTGADGKRLMFGGVLDGEQDEASD